MGIGLTVQGIVVVCYVPAVGVDQLFQIAVVFTQGRAMATY